MIGVTGSSGKLGQRHGRAAARRRARACIGFDLAGTPGAGFTRVDLADYGQTLDAFLGVHRPARRARRARASRGDPGERARPRCRDLREQHASPRSTCCSPRTRAGIRTHRHRVEHHGDGFPVRRCPAALPVDETLHRARTTPTASARCVEEAMAAQLAGWRRKPRSPRCASRMSSRRTEYDTFERAADPDYRRDLSASWIDARDGAHAVALALAAARRPGSESTTSRRRIRTAAPVARLAERWFPGTPVADDLGEFESLMSTRKLQRRARLPRRARLALRRRSRRRQRCMRGIRPRSALDRAGGEALHDLLVEEQVQDQDAERR